VPARDAVRDIAVGMVAGARHVAARPPAAAALLAIGLHRLGFGALTLMTLLLYRNTFDSRGGLFPGGIVGLGEVVAASALGTLLAAAVTPVVVRRIGTGPWITLLLAVGGMGQLALGLPFLPPTVVLGGLLLGFVAQAVKICVDTTLQELVEDDFRGRVFSLYDTVFNVAFVVALLVGAFALPPSGVSWPVLAAVAAGYLFAAAAYARIARNR
jgi:hypothetical protein